MLSREGGGSHVGSPGSAGPVLETGRAGPLSSRGDPRTFVAATSPPAPRARTPRAPSAERGRGGLLCPGRPEGRLPGAAGPPSPGAAGHGQGSPGLLSALSFSSSRGRRGRLQLAGLLFPWNLPCKNSGGDCHFLLQRVVPGQASTTRPTGVSLLLSLLGSPSALLALAIFL